MALIECTDCGSQISSSAKACPKCGAPAPKKNEPDPGNIFCPFCRTEVSEDAMICSGCDARRAYTRSGTRLYGKWQSIGFGIILPLILMAFFPPAGIILIPVMLYVVYRLIRGPVWYNYSDL